MKRIGIAGGGFCGTMTAVHVLRYSGTPCHVVLISDKKTLHKGIAYSPWSHKVLLNVPAGRMSAFADQPDHFLNWLLALPEYIHSDRSVVANAFMPRYLYGQYLEWIWEQTLSSSTSRMTIIDDHVTDADIHKHGITLHTGSNGSLDVDFFVIATGNNLPGNPEISDTGFFRSRKYFRNPWDVSAVQKIDRGKPVLLLGNGLSMVDTLLCLRENHFKGCVYSISPQGFDILPHRHPGIKYTRLTEELRDTQTLAEVATLFFKHLKAVRKFGISAEPVVDSLRAYTPQLWRRMSTSEKKYFMARLRHLWGVARHRMAVHVHDRIQHERINGSLKIVAGLIHSIVEEKGSVVVEYTDRNRQKTERIVVSRVINCTGPETDILRSDNPLLSNLLQKGNLIQDDLKLGIVAGINTFEVFNNARTPQFNLFTLGPLLKGEFWESTAVNELRVQAEHLGRLLAQKVV